MVFVDHLPNIEAVALWPVWRQTRSQAALRDLAFEIQAIAGKGVGLVAIRKIDAGHVD